MTPKEARAAIGAALTEVDGVRFYPDYGASIDPPATKVGLPALQFETGCPDPTSATFVVHLIDAASDYGLDRLMDLVPSVVAAIESLPEAVVTSALPSVWGYGGPDLPMYDITVEVAL